MDRMFKKLDLDNLEMANRFVFPPIKTAYGTPQEMSPIGISPIIDG